MNSCCMLRNNNVWLGICDESYQEDQPIYRHQHCTDAAEDKLILILEAWIILRLYLNQENTSNF